jgi:excisionase family DNA binding protein
MSADIITLPTVSAAPEASSPWWRIDEAAAYAKQHPQAIYRACRERKLEHARVGGRRAILVKREWVDSWLESLRVHIKPANRAA